MATGDDAKDTGHAAMEGTPPPPKYSIVIRMEEDSQVNVSFPGDPILAYGMLEQARLTLDRHFTDLSKPRVLPANGTLPSARRMLPGRRLLG